MSDELERIRALEQRLEDFVRRFNAHEMRHAREVEAMSEQINRMHDRFNQRQDALAREFGERIAALSNKGSAE